MGHNFAKALEAADESISLATDQTWPFSAARAHALMFLGRVDEARALYLQYRGTKRYDEKSWETIILDDFAALRKAGLTNPLMDEIEKQFTAAG